MRFVWKFALPVTALLFATETGPALAQSDLPAEIDALRKAQEAIQKDVAEIKKLLAEMRPKPPKPFHAADISLKGAPALGDPAAPVTIVEFTDYQCPFCRRHVKSTMPQLLREYVDTGKVRYVLRDFPLTRIHPRAAKAAETALCAGAQGKYWEMHARLFENQRRFSDDDLLNHAEAVGIDRATLKTCLDEKKYQQQVLAGIQEGAAAGVRGTPSFFLGLTDPTNGDKLHATKMLRGAQPFPAFKAAIQELLATQSGSE